MAADEERGVDVVDSVLTTASNSDRTQGNSSQGGRDADGSAGRREPTLEEQQPTQEDDQGERARGEERGISCAEIVTEFLNHNAGYETKRCGRLSVGGEVW